MERAYRATLLVGIAALPFAMVARRVVGLRLPVHRAVERLRHEYEQASS